jgi:glycosyltransferase involved in cell wall biosynthesis
MNREFGLLKYLPGSNGKIGWPWDEEIDPGLYTNHECEKVSIVVPSYNQVQFIEETIRSILLQNYPNLEIILIDGGSTDGTISIIKKYEKWIHYWVSEKDNGQSHALNKGFSKTTGKILGWLNSDDLYTKYSLFNAMNAFYKNPTKSVVFGDYLIIDKNSDLISYEYVFDFSLTQFIYEGFHLNAQSMFWKRGVHSNFGEFNENLHRTMDYDMILRFGINEGQSTFLRVDSIALGCFRRHEDQKTTGFDNIVLLEHKCISDINALKYKYLVKGKLIRFIYRFRRLFWYFKRGGLLFTIKKVFRLEV